jgi:hypothetical protein
MGVFKRGKNSWIDYLDKKRCQIHEPSRCAVRPDAEQLLALREFEALRSQYEGHVKISLWNSASGIWTYRLLQQKCDNLHHNAAGGSKTVTLAGPKLQCNKD